MMTRKDYRIVAAGIAEAAASFGRISHEAAVVETVATSIARELWANSGLDANGNRRFDKERFLRAALGREER